MEAAEAVTSKTSRWLVIYTRSKWEKKVDQLLKEKGIESFCPLIKKERQWADRKKVVEFPLFNSYVFVRIDTKEELTVRETSGVVNFIYHCGKPAVLRDQDIRDIQSYLEHYPDLETVNAADLGIGETVKIKEGLLTDQLGKIVKIEGKYVLMVIEELGCALTTKVKVNNIQRIK